MKLHIRHCMLYEYRKGVTAVAASESIPRVYGKGSCLRSTCTWWFARFKSGDCSLADMARSGRFVRIDDGALKSLVESDPRLSTRELAEQIGHSQSTVYRHLIAMGKRNRVGVWVPHELTAEQKNVRADICLELYMRELEKPFLGKIIATDEKWLFYENPKKKNQWLDPNQPAIPTPKPVLHSRKVLLCVWWDSIGVIHYELLPLGVTLNSQKYCLQLDDFRVAFKALCTPRWRKILSSPG